MIFPRLPSFLSYGARDVPILTCLKTGQTCLPLLTQIKGPHRRLTYNLLVKTTRVSVMFNSSELGDELQALKSEVS
jgi:hypothetical protein